MRGRQITTQEGRRSCYTERKEIGKRGGGTCSTRAQFRCSKCREERLDFVVLPSVRLFPQIFLCTLRTEKKFFPRYFFSILCSAINRGTEDKGPTVW